MTLDHSGGLGMIDWSRVKEVCDEIGSEDFDEVVELFLEEVEEVIGRLRTAPDPSQLEQDLHFLKGSALSLGFASFSSLCQNGERISAGGQAETVNVPEIVAEFERSKAGFLAELPERIAT
ncbi:Hpt domain-containing protein [Microbulbifer sp. S227A]|uniref:Hpt domain-containing protein n=1 Tax=Microbulbifer sp. S227A TaxID=3415131 RepID=UPI003C7BFB2A